MQFYRELCRKLRSLVALSFLKTSAAFMHLYNLWKNDYIFTVADNTKKIFGLLVCTKYSVYDRSDVITKFIRRWFEDVIRLILDSKQNEECALVL